MPQRTDPNAQRSSLNTNTGTSDSNDTNQRTPQPKNKSTRTSRINSNTSSSGRINLASVQNYTINSAPLAANNGNQIKLVVVSPDEGSVPQSVRENLHITKEYNWNVSQKCSEAMKGQIHGRFNCHKDSRSLGIPDKRFSHQQYEQQGDGGEWIVQSVFKSTKHDDRFLVQFEGCSPIFEYDSDEVKQCAPEAVEFSEVWYNFLKAVSNGGSAKIMTVSKRHVNLLNEKDETLIYDLANSFWLCRDLSYFHTVSQKEHGLNAVQYINLENDTVPPFFSYSAVNVTHSTTLERLLRSKNNRLCKRIQVSALNPDKVEKSVVKKLKKTTNCENKANCICEARFMILYGRQEAVVNMNSNEHGFLLIPPQLSQTDNYIFIECSDACGCSSICSRRPLQRAQQKPLAVFLEESNQWGIRAMCDYEQGEYIGEYTGMLHYAPPEPAEAGPTPDVPNGGRSSYSMSFNVIDERLRIDSRSIGNVMRFLACSSDPNCILVEVFSRANEKELLVPRIGVFALKAIKNGEPITFSDEKKAAPKNTAGDQKSTRIRENSTSSFLKRPRAISDDFTFGPPKAKRAAPTITEEDENFPALDETSESAMSSTAEETTGDPAAPNTTKKEGPQKDSMLFRPISTQKNEDLTALIKISGTAVKSNVRPTIGDPAAPNTTKKERPKQHGSHTSTQEDMLLSALDMISGPAGKSTVRSTTGDPAAPKTTKKEGPQLREKNTAQKDTKKEAKAEAHLAQELARIRSSTEYGQFFQSFQSFVGRLNNVNTTESGGLVRNLIHFATHLMEEHPKH